ncbi:hypothetical protein GCM10020358_85110 [Amorphoplanes nipponensis]
MYSGALPRVSEISLARGPPLGRSTVSGPECPTRAAMFLSSLELSKDAGLREDAGDPPRAATASRYGEPSVGRTRVAGVTPHVGPHGPPRGGQYGPPRVMPRTKVEEADRAVPAEGAWYT